MRPPRRLAFAVPGAVLAATFVVALAAAPNNWDSMVYHNARVMEWWDRGSVAPWDTPSERQLRMPPLASYFKLAFLGLTGNDVLFNVVQWAFFAFAILAAARLAARLVPVGARGAVGGAPRRDDPDGDPPEHEHAERRRRRGYVLAAAFFLVRAFARTARPRATSRSPGPRSASASRRREPRTSSSPSSSRRPRWRRSRGSRAGTKPGGGRGRRGWPRRGILGVLANVGFWRRNAGALGSPLSSATSSSARRRPPGGRRPGGRRSASRRRSAPPTCSSGSCGSSASRKRARRDAGDPPRARPERGRTRRSPPRSRSRGSRASRSTTRTPRRRRRRFSSSPGRR